MDATRAAGRVALLLMSASVLFGVLTAGRFSTGRWPRFLTVGLHRNLSLLALAFLALHVGTTVLDSYTSIPLSAAFLPFASPYKRFWLGLGAIALDLLAVLVLTSLARLRLGYRAWRVVHWSGYACWPVAVAHGVGAGTDEHHSWAAALTGRLHRTGRCGHRLAAAAALASSAGCCGSVWSWRPRWASRPRSA